MVSIITQNGCNEIQPWSKHMILLPLLQHSHVFIVFIPSFYSHQPALQSTAPLLQAMNCVNLLRASSALKISDQETVPHDGKE